MEDWIVANIKSIEMRENIAATVDIATLTVGGDHGEVSQVIYMGLGIHDIKGLVCFVFNIASQREEGENREGVHMQNKAHRTFDIINT